MKLKKQINVNVQGKNKSAQLQKFGGYWNKIKIKETQQTYEQHKC